MPSALVAPLVGVREFGLGSTLAFRAADLERVGGFAVVADYLADDYQLAKRIISIGKSVLLSTYVVETSVNEVSWRGVWQHQLRWARTIRLSKGNGYSGLPHYARGRVDGDRSCLRSLGSGEISACGKNRLRLDHRLFCPPQFHCDCFLLADTLVGRVCICRLGNVVYDREVRWRDRILAIDSEGRIQI